MSSSSRSCRPKWDCSTARWCRPSKSNGFSHDAGRYSPPAGTQECKKRGMCCTTLGLCIAQSWPPPQTFLRESTWGWRSDGMLLENGAAPASLAPPHRRPRSCDPPRAGLAPPVCVERGMGFFRLPLSGWVARRAAPPRSFRHAADAVNGP